MTLLWHALVWIGVVVWILFGLVGLVFVAYGIRDMRSVGPPGPFAPPPDPLKDPQANPTATP